MRRIIFGLVASTFCIAANATLLTVDFNVFTAPHSIIDPSSFSRSYSPYTENGVSISPATVVETTWASLYPDALLASYGLNGSGLLHGRLSPIEITTGGEFTLESVDVLSGLGNEGMSVSIAGYLDGMLTGVINLAFPVYDPMVTPPPPTSMAAWIYSQSWMLDVNGASLGTVDRLVLTQTDGINRCGACGRLYFLDNLVVNTVSVPEPATYSLLAIGLLGAFVARRKTRPAR